MKKSFITIGTFLIILLCNNATAQEKVKDKDDKSKMKNKDMDVKVKDKDDKYKAKEDDNKVKMKGEETKQPAEGMATSSLPYTANYSSNFVIGSADNAKMILDLWKDWDDNAFDRHDYMADTLVMLLPDGQLIKGKAANLEAAKKYRGGLTSAKSTLDAWIPLKSVDRNENWVALWGQEEDVLPDGKTQKKEIHEIWRINKDGKVDFMKQWVATPPPPPPPPAK